MSYKISRNDKNSILSGFFIFSIIALQIHSWGFVSELMCVITFFILDIFVILELFNWSFIAVFVANHLI